MTSGGWGGVLSVPFTHSPGQWVHVAFTHDQDNLTKLYIDGLEAARLKTTRRTFAAVQQPLRIGAGLRGPDRQRIEQRFEGAIDDLLVYERALSAEEISALARGAAAGR